MEKKTKYLAVLQQRGRSGDQEEIKKLQVEIDQLLEQEDVKWKQRAKRHWYQKGEKNTHFFHAWASHRKRINHIKRVRDDDGREWTQPEDIAQVFVNFYQQLFHTEGPRDIDECLEGLKAWVTPKMNGWLLRRFVAEEVDVALSQMGSLKSPGLDGFAACFYQKSWDTVR